MTFDAVLTEPVHRQACEHLLRHVRGGHRQEEVCFALWRPGTGTDRQSAIVFDLVLPAAGERHLHGNASFEPGYLTRAVRLACARRAGLAFMHNHLSGGWQDMSKPDIVAERDRIAAPARASGLPLVGLTLATDGAWSARFWTWDGTRFRRSWCTKVRVVGRRLRVTCNDALLPPPGRRAALRRTIDTWGEARQQDIARLRVGIIGVGSVGCMVAETLARMGVENLVLVDPDRVETHNLDRLLYASEDDVGEYKVNLAVRNLERGATAERFHVEAHARPIQHEAAYSAVLDCDLLFSAVDRPLPKDLLNRIAYAHCIPVISGGVHIDNKPSGELANALWSVTVVGPERRCLRCDGQYTSSDVVLERDGSLDDPAYVRRQGDVRTPTNQNVFPFSANLASLMAIEMVRLTVAETWWPDPGDKLSYSLIPGRLRAAHERCEDACSVSEGTALGDRYRYPFLVDAEPAGSPTGVAAAAMEIVKRMVRAGRRLLRVSEWGR